MDEDPLPKSYEDFKKDWRLLGKIIIGLFFWTIIFMGLFLIVGYVAATYTFNGVL